MDMSKRIRSRRNLMGLSSKELAKRANCAASVITNFESGRLPKKMDTGAIARVKKVLKLRVSEPKRKTAKVSRETNKSGLESAILALAKAIEAQTKALEAMNAPVVREYKPDRYSTETIPYI